MSESPAQNAEKDPADWVLNSDRNLPVASWVTRVKSLSICR